MKNKSKFKLSAKKNPNQIDHLGRKQSEILNQALCLDILIDSSTSGSGWLEEDDDDAVKNINNIFTLKFINSS